MKTISSTLQQPRVLLGVLLLPFSTVGEVDYSTPYTFTTIAGSAAYGCADGTGSEARFFYPSGVSVDGEGNVYVADTSNHTIRKVMAAGVVTTLAGVAQYDYFRNPVGGSADGTGSAARFKAPTGVAVDSAGNVYVADYNNHTIRRVTQEGVVTTLAGAAGAYGSADGTGRTARFNHPSAVAADHDGNIYVADEYNSAIRKVTPAGVVTTLAGPGSAAQFNGPSGVAVDADGNVYVADSGNHTIRKVTPAGLVSTLAGLAGVSGSDDGVGNAARFNGPCGVAVDGQGVVYVGDTRNFTIRKVTPAGAVTTLAGLARSSGTSDGSGSAARFNDPASVAVDSEGNIYVADYWNNKVRKVTPAGVVTTLAGLEGGAGSEDGTGSAARFYEPSGVAVDRAGNVFVTDSVNSTIRKITPTQTVTTFAGRAGYRGSTDGTGSAARFGSAAEGPTGVAIDSDDNLYVADTGNHTIRKVTPAGVVTTLAGRAGVPGSVDGTGGAARFNFPFGVAVDSDRNVYVADEYNHTIRKVTPSGVVTTLAGLAGAWGRADGVGPVARFHFPCGVAVDSNGNVYVADELNCVIRRLTQAGEVSTFAGGGGPGTADGVGDAVRFSAPMGLALDDTGNLYVTDNFDKTLRIVTPAGRARTLAGKPENPGSADGTGVAARFYKPRGVAVDSEGNVYVADTENHTIRKGWREPLAPAFTNITWSPSGEFQGQLLVESGQSYSVEASSDLVHWRFAFPFQATSSLFTLPSGGGPDADIMFLRVRVGRPPYYQLRFGLSAMGGSFAGEATASVIYPVSLSQYQVLLQVDNVEATNCPPGTNVWFTGPPGSGLSQAPAVAFGLPPSPDHFGWYRSPTVFSPVSPSPGPWTIRYGETNLTFDPPNPTTVNPLVVPVPTVTVSTGMLQSLGFVFREGQTGAAMDRPGWLWEMFIELEGPAGRIYESDSFSPRQTNYILSSSIQWSQVSKVSIGYRGNFDGSYTFTYLHP